MAEAERILVITSVRDEGSNLLHWIAHCRALGVTDFLVFSNDCADGTDVLLDLLQAGGILSHVRNRVPDGKTPQWSALHQARGHPLLDEADWIAVLDCDEYLNLRAPYDTLQDLLADTQADAIALPWRLFGHNGHVSRPDLPPTRAYTTAIPEDALYPALGRFIKTLYRRAGPFQKPGVHRPKQSGPAAWIDGSGQPLPDRFSEDQGQIMLWGGPLANACVQLNHYSVRSAEDFVAKARRGLPNHTEKPVDLTYWVERNFNTVPDDTILRHEPRTDAELAGLYALPGIIEAEAGARDWHARAFRMALADPSWVKIYGRLLLAASSQPPPPDVARKLVALFQNATRTPD
ncbi:glycosyltransferase family 2 protein [Maribius pontilimi]|uniref:Glycosyltransferase family 2 protein n=1 Tax=Palleronia pontilimi TaxID=1964209 RepID=A0A934IGM7_9RHOB|nr:glycosyltransferase family 2 protein [Palleronia pontilimi]MBJ3762230.1 glycosyltransferase family 2 protein [Palleronia pontilimi]